MGTGVRFACITHGGPRPRGAARVPNQSSLLIGKRLAKTPYLELRAQAIG